MSGNNGEMETGSLPWTRKQRETQNLLRTAYDCSNDDVFHIMHGMNPDWESWKTTTRNAANIRDDYVARHCKRRGRMWQTIAKDVYSEVEVAGYQELKKEVESVAVRLGIKLIEVSSPPPCLTAAPTPASAPGGQSSLSFNAGKSIALGGKHLPRMRSTLANARKSLLGSGSSATPAATPQPDGPRRPCRRCKQRKKGCKGGRPCTRCQASGIDYAGCVPEGEEAAEEEAQKNSEELEEKTVEDDAPLAIAPLTPAAVLDRIPPGSRTGRMLHTPSNFPREDSPMQSIEGEATDGNEDRSSNDGPPENIPRRMTRSRASLAAVGLGQQHVDDEESDEGGSSKIHDQDDPEVSIEEAIGANIVSTSPGKLSMVHHSHLTWKSDRILFIPRGPKDDRSFTVHGYIDPIGTHKAIYDYGGPIYRVVRCAPVSDTGSREELHEEDVMVCMKDYCTICATGSYKPPVPAASQSRYRTMGFVHLRKDCKLDADGAWRFQQAGAQGYNTMLNGTTTDKIEFLAGESLQCCVCLDGCSFCDPDERAYDNSEVDTARQQSGN